MECLLYPNWSCISIVFLFYPDLDGYIHTFMTTWILIIIALLYDTWLSPFHSFFSQNNPHILSLLSHTCTKTNSTPSQKRMPKWQNASLVRKNSKRRPADQHPTVHRLNSRRRNRPNWRRARLKNVLQCAKSSAGDVSLWLWLFALFLLQWIDSCICVPGNELNWISLTITWILFEFVSWTLDYARVSLPSFFENRSRCDWWLLLHLPVANNVWYNLMVSCDFDTNACVWHNNLCICMHVY